MRSFTLISALLGVAMAAPSFLLTPRATNGFTIARPGTIKNVIVTEENTLNSTSTPDSIKVQDFEVQAVKPLPLELINNFGGGNINAYIQGLDPRGAVVFIGANGQTIYPSSGGSKTPVPINAPIAIPLPGRGQKLTINLPFSITSGRVYFCEGELKFFVVRTDIGEGIVQPSVTNIQDPSTSLNWGFVELTYTDQGVIYANISYVDFVGMILSMSLSTTDGTPDQITKGLRASAVNDLCNGLVAQKNRDNMPWSSMCIARSDGRPIRVLSPTDFQSVDANAFARYWDAYADQVWRKYASEPLTINTQTPRGNVKCNVRNNRMVCDGDNRDYVKPTARDIWGCDSGPFGKIGNENDVHLAVIPRLCAAFVRSTLLVAGGNVQPSLKADRYYKADPTSHYSRLIHELQVDGRGYAFPYDDVNPDGNQDASGLVSSGNPRALHVYIGGYA